jgi:predicted ABC-type ATPase
VKELVVLGGPNGAGKTTAAQTMIPKVLGIREFVNADEIARGLSPFNPEAAAIAAGRLMVERIRALADAGENFAFETTCAGRGHARLLRMCRAAGYRVTLVFLWLPSAEAALKRVARRVREGGHNLAEDIVRRRYVAGLRNLPNLYLPVVDVGVIFDNSDDGRRAIIAEWVQGKGMTVRDPKRWASIEEAAK